MRSTLARPSHAAVLTFVRCCSLVLVAATACHAVAETPGELLRSEKLAGGLVVQVGCGNPDSLAELQLHDGFRVLALDTDGARVDAARRAIAEAGRYGTTSADRFDGRRLPLIDNIVNALIVAEPFALEASELHRVLCPEGVLFQASEGKWTRTTKARPGDIDVWTHFLHDPSNNAVAHDEVIDVPRHLQWTAGPRYSRHHDHMASVSAMVSNGPQVFSIIDMGSRWSIFMPADWHLVARDAFNGTKLWDKPMGKWFTHHYSLKSGPGDLPRRLVAIDDTVYFTPAIDAPLEKVDAATGETLHVYERTAATEEIVYDDGWLLLKVNRPENQLTFDTVQTARRNNGGVPFNLDPRRIMMVNAESGETLWERESVVMPTTLATDGERVYYHDGESVVGLDRQTGTELWKQPVSRWAKMLTFFTPTLVVYDGVVLFAGGENMIPHRGGKDTMTALDARTGDVLWTAYHGPSGYQSSEDVLVSGGLVWCGETTSGSLSGVFTGRDPKTGEVKIEFEPDVDTYWFHHRCYRAKATDKFLLTSRTGIEFLNTKEESWTIHHWVRSGCLYGVMPCNGMVYTLPTNCACYPEIKLYGFNALAPERPNGYQLPVADEASRLERGVAFDASGDAPSDGFDWPCFRGGNDRSGCSPCELPAELTMRWQSEALGQLSAPVVAGGTIYVASTEAHQVLALSGQDGSIKWSYTAGGRIDSPPTLYANHLYFGSADGYVYCLRAADGQLVWRYLVAPSDMRLIAYDQLESLWPVHGSVMIEDGRLYTIAGRNAFLDGGLRLVVLDPVSGQLLAENTFDDKDPATGENLQTRLKVLQMPTGLNDILSSDGKYVYLMSQVIDKEGKRDDLGPHSGDAAEHASVQRGETAHLYAPFGGYLDGDWFHRSYWVFGRSFAGGHNGYYQAGKFTPAGRLLVFDDENVYGFGRLPQYLKWTTPLEHQLFCADREPREPPVTRRGEPTKVTQVVNRPALNPAGKALVVEAWVRAEKPNGVIVARGGPAQGFALMLQQGVPRMLLRSNEELFSVAARGKRIVGAWHHVAGSLTADRQLKIYVDGALVGSRSVPRLVETEPQQPMEIGSDQQSAVGEYKSPSTFTGLIDDVKIYFGELSDQEIASHAAADPSDVPQTDAPLVFHATFDDGKATDLSGKGNDGEVRGVKAVESKFGFALRFEGNPGTAQSPYYVVHKWKERIGLHVRAMVKSGDKLFVMGPPDIMDEDEAFVARLTPDLLEQFRAQDEALDGLQGSILMSVAADTGEILAQQQYAEMPRWDGMAVADGRMYVVTMTGRVLCLGN